MKTPLGLSLYLWLAVSDALISSNLGHLGDLAGFSQLLRWCVGRHRVPVDCQVKPFGIHAKVMYAEQYDTYWGLLLAWDHVQLGSDLWRTTGVCAAHLEWRCMGAR